MDIISRLPGCAGQAADAVSAYTQVKMEDAPSLSKIPKSECPDIWVCLPKHKWPKSWSSMEDPVVPLDWEKVPIWECWFINQEKGLFLSVYVDEKKTGCKQKNINPKWKILMKNVDLGGTDIIP